MKYLFASESSAAVPERKPASGRGPRGKFLVLARTVWVIVAIFTLTLFVASIPVAFARLQDVCSAGGCVYGQLSREGLRALQGLGLSPGFYAAYVVALDIVFASVYAAVAALLFLRRPADRMALFVSLALLTFGAATFTDTMDVLAAEPSVWRLPDMVLQAVGTIAFGLFLYLFPDGRFVPPWTGPVALVWVVWQLSEYLLTPSTVPEGNGLSVWVVLAVWIVALGTAVYAQVYRYRHVSDAVERQQIKWVVFGISAALCGFLGTTLVLAAFTPGAASPGALLAQLVGHAISYAALLLIPISIGIAILRFRLFDIDFIINRTSSMPLLLRASSGSTCWWWAAWGPCYRSRETSWFRSSPRDSSPCSSSPCAIDCSAP